jgi:predicted dehydrogenase
MTSPRIPRRRLLGAFSAGSAMVVARHVLGGPGATPPSDRIGIGGIGIGGMGAANLGAVQSENIVALCDVDHAFAANTFKKYPDAKRYTDYRKLLAQKDVDAVIVATPDHTHAVITMAAMKAGKHVYTQKPLTHDVHEARMLAKAMAECKVATQMGIQGHSGDYQRTTAEWVRGGAIGEVREVVAWCSLTYVPWGHASWSTKWSRRPAEEMPLPGGLDWELWIGPAPMRPYHRAYHPTTWRAWWDFGNGMMGDRGVHSLDPVVAALGLGAPSAVEATSKDLNPDTHPVSSVVTFHFPARNGTPALKVTWYDGLVPPAPEFLKDPGILKKGAYSEGGSMIIGSKGLVLAGVYGNDPKLFPEELGQGFQPKERLPRVGCSHEQDWVRACKAGKQPGAHFGYSGPLTEICCLGNIAKRVDGRIEWDAEKLRVTNNPKANEYVRTEYRKGWLL